MNIEQHIENLKNYLKFDINYSNPKTVESDFDKFCYNHCKDIDVVLKEINKLNNVIDRMSNLIEDKMSSNVYDFLEICNKCKDNNEDCHGDYCKETIKEYFMKEDN